MNKLNQIYKKLHSSYGNLNWWPTTIRGTKPEYHGKKINTTQRFEIIVGAILTQNTSWKNVEKAIENLNKENLLTAEKIAKTKQEKLAKLIRPAGYFNQKSERLKIIAKYFLKNPKLLKKPVLELRRELLSIKGIGPETADSIILYASEQPIFVIDAYTKRIFSRLGHCKEDHAYDELQELFMKNLQPDTLLFKNYHALLVELAKQHCKKKPACRGCPLSSMCKNI